jgi:acyl dehydratase
VHVSWLYASFHAWNAEDVNIGDDIPALSTKPITHLQLVCYAGASGDFNPLHTDPKVGEMIGTGGIIAHGMLIMGFVGQMVSDYVGPQGCANLVFALREWRTLMM